MTGSERGFTLLEVLGAVAVLALVYVVLAGAAIQGLRAEGDAGRRLRASELADRELASVEETLALGTAPPPGVTTASEDEFEVETTVAPFAPPPELAAALAESEPGAASLFEPTRPGDPGAVRSIEVRVRWDDGSGPREVVRATWAVDPIAMQEAAQLAGLDAAAGAAGTPGAGDGPGATGGPGPPGATSGSSPSLPPGVRR